MLALPDLAATPRTYTTAQSNPLAAKMALTLAGDTQLCMPRRAKQLELDVLKDQLRAWLDRQLEGLRFVRPRLHVALGHGPHDDVVGDDAYTVWLGNAGHEEFFGSVWQLESRWRALEAAAPGLAPAALNAIDHAGRHAFPVYAPGTALYWASTRWWYGEEDEEVALAEWREQEGASAPIPDDLPTRAWLDKVLPPAVTRPRTKLKRAGLEQLARRRTDVGEIARLVLALDAACKAWHRRKSPFEFSSQTEDGFLCVGFSAVLRWNGRDPMFRIFDDYANDAFNSEGANEAFGFCIVEGADKLPAMLAELEHYFTLGRLVDRLLPLVATKVRG